MPRLLARLGLIAAVACSALPGCSDELDPEGLWDVDSPEPNQLKGVYQLFATDGNSNIEIRLRFTDHTVVGSVRCAPKNPKFPGLEAGATANMGIEDVEASEGRFDVDALTMSKNQDPIFCEGGLAADTYAFKVDGLSLSLTRPKVPGTIIYKKIGQ